MTRKQFLDLLSWIQAEVPDASSGLTRLRRQRQAPFLKVLLGTILSHQTTSRQTRLATERLWGSYRTLDRLADAGPAHIARLIRNVGLGGLKARRLAAIAAKITQRWTSVARLARYVRSAPLEDARAALLELPGVGPKTAAVVLLFRFHRPTFPVDTNILRVARGLGWVGKGADPEDVRAVVERILPRDPALLLKAHAYLIALGRATQRGRRRDLIDRLRDFGSDRGAVKRSTSRRCARM
jgi:endonuclease III